MKKEMIRFYVSVSLAIVAVIFSVLAVSGGISVIFADPAEGSEALPGSGLFAFAFLYLTEFLTACFAASASALAAFFAFSTRKCEKNTIKNASFLIFGICAFLGFLDILTAVVMSL